MYIILLLHLLCILLFCCIFSWNPAHDTTFLLSRGSIRNYFSTSYRLGKSLPNKNLNFRTFHLSALCYLFLSVKTTYSSVIISGFTASCFLLAILIFNWSSVKLSPATDDRWNKHSDVHRATLLIHLKNGWNESGCVKKLPRKFKSRGTCGVYIFVLQQQCCVSYPKCSYVSCLVEYFTIGLNMVRYILE